MTLYIKKMRAKPNSKHKTYSLDNDSVKNLEEGAKLNGMNNSEFIEFLANSWENSIDPSKKLKQVRQDKAVLKERLTELEMEESKIIDILQKKDEWHVARQSRKPSIVLNLMRVISEGRYSDAEVIAKNQSIALGIPAISLLSEASEKLSKGQ